MDIPAPLRAALDRLAGDGDRASLVRDAQALSQRYRTQARDGSRLLHSDGDAIAYALSRMPATLCAVQTALAWSLEAYGDDAAALHTLLDVGAGTGAASFAACALLPIERITCIEREDAMRRIGQALMAQAAGGWDGFDAQNATTTADARGNAAAETRADTNNDIRANRSPSAPGSPPSPVPDHTASAAHPLRDADWIASDLAAARDLPAHDLVIAGYVLGELSPETREAFVLRLWRASSRLLLLVEPGTPSGYVSLMAARDRLLREGAHVLAPCPHESACPLEPGDWCHFRCRVPRGKLHRQLKAGEAPYEDEKFAYMALAREPHDAPGVRVLRHPSIYSGFIELRVCTAHGVGIRKLSKRDGALYKRARKIDAGDALADA